MRKSRFEEKSRRRDKSSDSHFIHSDFIKSINIRSNEDELRVLTELSFWEKIGFTNNSKRQMMMIKGKTKLDESYNWLRATLIQGK
jgi:hypothetical protein